MLPTSLQSMNDPWLTPRKLQELKGNCQRDQLLAWASGYRLPWQLATVDSLKPPAKHQCSNRCAKRNPQKMLVNFGEPRIDKLISQMISLSVCQLIRIHHMLYVVSYNQLVYLLDGVLSRVLLMSKVQRNSSNVDPLVHGRSIAIA